MTAKVDNSCAVAAAEFPAWRPGYLDSAAKSLTARCALRAMQEYYLHCDANVERGLHRRSQQASALLAEARARVACLVGGREDEIVFARGTTEAINLAAAGLPLQPGARILSSLLEHHSNYLPWLRRSSALGGQTVTIGADPEGFIDPEAVERELARGAALLAFTWVSNALGSVQAVSEICALARRHGCLTLVDGAQGVPHLEASVRDLGCDLLAWSGHKMFGPTGTGALWARAELLEQMQPLLVGGGSIADVDVGSYSLEREPVHEALESGTPNIAGLIGFGEAALLTQQLLRSGELQRGAELADWTGAALSNIDGVGVAGPAGPGRRGGVVSFWIEGLRPHQTAALLDERFDIAVRSGHHCTLPLMKHLLRRPEGTVRASFQVYSTRAEAEALVAAVAELAREGAR